MDHLALNVYLWDWPGQDRLAADCLAPLARAMRAEGVARRFTFSRFDARGPHLFALLSVPAGRADEARGRVEAAVGAWLAENPAERSLSAEELEQRHAECRGKRLCALDDAEGFAEPGSFAIAAHGPPRWPFGTFPEGDDALWEEVTELALWSAARLGEGSRTGAAIGWIAAADHALGRQGADAAAYWRHHAGTLLPGMRERLPSDDDALLALLEGAVGARNRATFDLAWSAPAGPRADAGALVAAALRAGGEGTLREANHLTLLQLGLPVRAHVPLVLHAWHRNLSRRSPTGAAS